MVFYSMLYFIGWEVVVIQAVKLGIVFCTRGWTKIRRGWRFRWVCGQVMRSTIRWNWCGAVPRFMRGVICMPGWLWMINWCHWMGMMGFVIWGLIRTVCWCSLE